MPAAWYSRKLDSRVLRYVLAVLATAAALLIRRALNPALGTSLPYITFFPALVFLAVYCGPGPSLLGVLLSAIGAKYWFLAPLRSFDLPSTPDWIGMLVFLLASAFIIVVAESRRRETERLRHSQEELEERVQKRTAELDNANRSLRDLTGRLLHLQDEERRRFARELHDSVGQILAALGINLAMAKTEINRLTHTVQVLTESEGLVQEMSTEVRTISHLLHPPLLDEAGLPSALEWYINGFSQRSKIKVDLQLPANLERLSQELETTIFRVVQECLTNIHRHAGSPTAAVRIAHSDGFVLVHVEDHGKGIAPEKLAQMTAGGVPGVGLRGMRERVRQLGGTLDVVSSSGRGTTVRARLPLTAASSTAAA